MNGLRLRLTIACQPKPINSFTREIRENRTNSGSRCSKKLMPSENASICLYGHLFPYCDFLVWYRTYRSTAVAAYVFTMHFAFMLDFISLSCFLIFQTEGLLQQSERWICARCPGRFHRRSVWICWLKTKAAESGKPLWVALCNDSEIFSHLHTHRRKL